MRIFAINILLKTEIVVRFMSDKLGSKNITTLAFALAANFIGFAGSNQIANAADISTPKSVVELFTSQGCSSCPPADDALTELIKDKKYLGLAYHVDYWDYIGWKDTFGDQEFTKRQRKYASAMNERQIYTPQAIVNGRSHMNGAYKSKIVKTSQDYLKNGKGLTVPINVVEKNGRISVNIKADDKYKDATLYAVYFEPESVVDIKRGENAGKKITYTNIVRKIEMLGMTGKNGLHAEFSLADVKAKGFKNYALILQSKNKDMTPNAIIGASLITNL